ncbi:UNVERIFIED_CONTAM: hypothetical protein PYX00_007636 [Menopon gallinae]
MLINQGKKVNADYHVFDACSLVKLFFRELPQPLIPYNCQEIVLSCLLLSSQQKQVEALMLVCLLLPVENLRTLAFFMEFLLKVSKYSDVNKMSKKNLAIILTPTLMPAQKGTASSSLDMTHHIKALELLIEHSERIGVIPEHIEGSLKCEKIKKKKRSGSLTRMFTGLKKIVGNKPPSTPDWDDSGLSTPGSLTSLGKRKSTENNAVSGLLAKKKRIANLLPDGALLATPLRCRMHGYVTPGFPSSVVPRNLKKASSGSPPSKIRKNISRNSDEDEKKTSSSNIVRKCLTKRQKSLSTVGSSSSIGNLFSLGNSKASLGMMGWGRKKTRSNLFLNRSDPDYQDEDYSENAADSSDESELITVNKSEYEDIKNRVLALEEEIEILNAAHSIQSAYEKTLEESEKLSSSSTERLARRLSKELKIRGSEGKVIRSPSARKIGSIRRRSKESLQRSMEHKTSLRRGRPNTLQSGLPSPGTRRITNEEAVTPCQEDPSVMENGWQSGEKFFARDYLLQKLMPVPQGRPSIVEIRNHNAGMVLEKAKLFNALNEDREVKLQKRQSVRLENMRRMKEMESEQKKLLTRTSSLGADNQKGTDLRAALRKNISNQSVKKNCVSFAQTSPAESKRPTPVIKKCLNTRSPRTLTKTPMTQLKSTARTRATPIRALLDPYGTPRISVRRSPRILARTLTSSPRSKDQ